jgi:hypothetical protein
VSRFALDPADLIYLFVSLEGHHLSPLPHQRFAVPSSRQKLTVIQVPSLWATGRRQEMLITSSDMYEPPYTWPNTCFNKGASSDAARTQAPRCLQTAPSGRRERGYDRTQVPFPAKGSSPTASARTAETQTCTLDVRAHLLSSAHYQYLSSFQGSPRMW